MIIPNVAILPLKDACFVGFVRVLCYIFETVGRHKKGQRYGK